MEFSDILKSGFLEKFQGLSLLDSALALLGAYLAGMFIRYVYKKTFTSVMYSTNFSYSLVLLTMLTAFVILAVTTNVVLSLGMVGALSIVRFRTAIKDPLDLVFLFWAIGAGIIFGAGLFPLAVIGSLFIGIVLLKFKTGKVNGSSYILLVDLTNETAEISASTIISKKCARSRLKSKTIRGQDIELIYEIDTGKEDTEFLNEISAIKGVINTTLTGCSDYLG